MINAYFLMLLVMTYEALFFLMIILGLMVGHGIFQIHLAETKPIPNNAGYAPMIQTPDDGISGGSPCCGGAEDELAVK